MAHKCMATGCRCQIADHLLMCGKHWRMVPQDVQSRVYDTYRRGLKIGESDERFQAVSDAIAAVEAKENKP